MTGILKTKKKENINLKKIARIDSYRDKKYSTEEACKKCNISVTQYYRLKKNEKEKKVQPQDGGQLKELPELPKLPAETVKLENETTLGVVKSNNEISKDINEEHTTGKKNQKLKEYEKIYKKIQNIYKKEHISIAAACEKCKISTPKYYIICKELGKKSVASEK